ncbi:hypothetical protein FGIG_02560 [Fasciola gigantica]|uniref:Molybdopterin synthase catalytic subunit n=1 Tax=Fasciola gigantica TaxID=46835 RepID=A0A504YYP5_FASGI|nr:hypothetical protein FGIG_02560 [Fasciola gigantica]
MKHLLLSTDSIDPASLIKSISDNSCGAVVTFFGITRADSDGNTVLHLYYEAHEQMAIRVMNDIADECQSTWQTLKNLAIVHRLG